MDHPVSRKEDPVSKMGPGFTKGGHCFPKKGDSGSRIGVLGSRNGAPVSRKGEIGFLNVSRMGTWFWEDLFSVCRLDGRSVRHNLRAGSYTSMLLSVHLFQGTTAFLTFSLRPSHRQHCSHLQSFLTFFTQHRLILKKKLCIQGLYFIFAQQSNLSPLLISFYITCKNFILIPRISPNVNSN